MRTAVEMLDRLKPFSQFVVMTATLTTKSLDLLRVLGGQFVSLTPDK